MKLVLATPLYPPEIGGPATYAKALVEGLPALGIEVELVKFEDVRGLPKLLRHFAYYKRVLIAARSADAVLALDPVSTGLPAMRAAKKTHRPFFVKIVGDYAWEQGRQRFGIIEDLDVFVKNKNVPIAVKILRKIETRVAAAATRVLVPSNYLKTIIEVWGIPADKIEVIYNAVPLEALGTVPRAVDQLPRPLVVTAGRLVPWKHIDGAIDAVAKLRMHGIEASLAIIGDGPLRAELTHKAEEALGTAFTFTGALSHADTLATMQAANVFTLNSSYEGLSHFLIEAMLLGLPTVATNVGGNSEVVADERSGLLVPSGDTSTLATTLERVLRDEDLRTRLSERAKESSTQFVPEMMLAKTAAFLKQFTK